MQSHILPISIPTIFVISPSYTGIRECPRSTIFKIAELRIEAEGVDQYITSLYTSLVITVSKLKAYTLLRGVITDAAVLPRDEVSMSSNKVYPD